MLCQPEWTLRMWECGTRWRRGGSTGAGCSSDIAAKCECGCPAGDVLMCPSSVVAKATTAVNLTSECRQMFRKKKKKRCSAEKWSARAHSLPLPRYQELAVRDGYGCFPASSPGLYTVRTSYLALFRQIAYFKKVVPKAIHVARCLLVPNPKGISGGSTLNPVCGRPRRAAR